MNGGLDDAIESSSPEEIRNAAAGFGYFGLIAVAELLTDALARSEGDPSDESLADAADERYNHFVPSDDVILKVFEAKLLQAPLDFAPLGGGYISPSG